MPGEVGGCNAAAYWQVHIGRVFRPEAGTRSHAPLQAADTAANQAPSFCGCMAGRQSSSEARGMGKQAAS